MDTAEKIANFFVKLRSLPDSKKKIILWTIVVILGAVMGFFWVKGVVNSLPKIESSVKSINLSPSNILQQTESNNK